MIHQGNNTILQDVRPSDAVVLAVRCGVPITVSESVLDKLP